MISKSRQLSVTEPLRVPPPAFVMLNDCVEELWPTVMLPKLRGVVWLTLQTGDGESPFPVQETSKLQGVPVSIVHVLGPVDWGVKRTCTVTDSPAAKLYDPLPDVISKSGQLSLTEPLRVPPPVFVILNDCVEELLPVTTFPNLRVSFGETEHLGLL